VSSASRHRRAARAPTGPTCRPGLAQRLDGTYPASPRPAAATGRVLLPVAVAVAVYVPTLQNGFVWDDPLVLGQLRSITSAGDLVTLPPSIPKFYFRPVVFVTYLIDRWIGGESPFWFHVSVVAFHALNTALVFLLTRRLFDGDDLVASGGALLFAVSDARRVRRVDGGPSDVIACTFILLTVLLYLDTTRPWAAWLGAATYFLALLSKELAVALLLLVRSSTSCSGDACAGSSTSRWAWPRSRTWPCATTPSGHRWAARRSRSARWSSRARSCGRSGVRRAHSAPGGHLTVRSRRPDRSGLCRDRRRRHPGSGALAVTAWRRRNWATPFLVAWFFIMLAPSLTVIVRRSASAAIADRYLYVPSVASCILIAWGVVVLLRRWQAAPPWTAAVLIASSVSHWAPRPWPTVGCGGTTTRSGPWRPRAHRATACRTGSSQQRCWIVATSPAPKRSCAWHWPASRIAKGWR